MIVIAAVVVVIVVIIPRPSSMFRCSCSSVAGGQGRFASRGWRRRRRRRHGGNTSDGFGFCLVSVFQFSRKEQAVWMVAMVQHPLSFKTTKRNEIHSKRTTQGSKVLFFFAY